jgi:rubrerythrin
MYLSSNKQDMETTTRVDVILGNTAGTQQKTKDAALNKRIEEARARKQTADMYRQQMAVQQAKQLEADGGRVWRCKRCGI